MLMDSQPNDATQEGVSPKAQREALERFVLDNADLMRLEERTSQFNIFEALGIVRQEIRHSNFLAWLMNPAQTHGLGDSFLKGFLLKTSVMARELGIETISPIDVDVWDLSATEVRREWRNIDVTLLEESRKFVCVIENKVHSSEHSDQLRRYREVVEAEFPDYTRHYVLLNVSGEEPSDSDYYVGVTYDEVCDVIERLLKMRASTIGDDVSTALSHYVTMVRRRVMPDREIRELCRRIYRKHQAALDLIFEHRPDRQAEIGAFLLEMIETDPEFTLDVSNKTFIRFRPVSWDRPELQQAQGWTKTGIIVLFEFFNSSQWNPNSLGLKLTLGPGDENVRRQIYEAATKAGSPFKPSQKGLAGKWVQLFWMKDILDPDDYDDLDFEEIQSRVQEEWSAFRSNEFPVIKDLIDRVFP
jgi:hypothetical protein